MNDMHDMNPQPGNLPYACARTRFGGKGFISFISFMAVPFADRFRGLRDGLAGVNFPGETRLSARLERSLMRGVMTSPIPLEHRPWPQDVRSATPPGATCADVRRRGRAAPARSCCAVERFG
jgi:hypothetical protein